MSAWPVQSDCCNPCATCCIAQSCSCITAGQNAEKGGTGTCLGVGGSIAIATVLLVAGEIISLYGDSMRAQAALDNDFRQLCLDMNANWGSNSECPEENPNEGTGAALWVVGLLLLIICSITRDALHVKFRGDIAKKFGKDPNLCPACCLYFMGCHCIPLVQEWKVVNNFGCGQAQPGVVVGAPVATA